jgi:hypothetical protein
MHADPRRAIHIFEGNLNCVVSLEGNGHDLYSVYLNQDNERELFCSRRQTSATFERGHFFLRSPPNLQHRIRGANGNAIGSDLRQIQAKIRHRAYAAGKLNALRLKCERRPSANIEREDLAWKLLQFIYAFSGKDFFKWSRNFASRLEIVNLDRALTCLTTAEICSWMELRQLCARNSLSGRQP